MSNAAASRLVMVRVSLVYRNGADIEKLFFGLVSTTFGLRFSW